MGSSLGTGTSLETGSSLGTGSSLEMGSSLGIGTEIETETIPMHIIYINLNQGINLISL